MQTVIQRYPWRRPRPPPPQPTESGSTLRYILVCLILLLVIGAILGLVLGLVLPQRTATAPQSNPVNCGPGYTRAAYTANGNCIDIDECNGYPTLCPSGYQCVNKPGSYDCLPCGSGFTASPDGRSCYPSTPSSPCSTYACAAIHGSQCIPTGTEGAYQCVCPSGLVQIKGECQTPTVPNPCQSGACGGKLNSVCVPTSVSGGYQGYQCLCVAGYTEVNGQCQQPPDPCLVAGTCAYLTGSRCYLTDNRGGHTCLCPTGTVQINGQCQPQQQCQSQTCQNGGTCISTAAQTVCLCLPGYSGQLCQIASHCAQSPCANGVCSNAFNGHYCTCYEGWQGDRCDIQMTDCDRFPWQCVHGECLDSAPGSTCDCDDGYEGDMCDIVSDDCINNHCDLDHSDCVDGDRGYTCDCEINWYGARCDREDCAKIGDYCSTIEDCCQTGGECCFNTCAPACRNTGGPPGTTPG